MGARGGFTVGAGSAAAVGDGFPVGHVPVSQEAA